MTIPANYFIRPLPQGLEGLMELALDLRWSWNHAADKLWEQIDSELWAQTSNPWIILQSVTTSRLKELAADPVFNKQMNELIKSHGEVLEETSWFNQAYPKSSLNVAYFSMEFGLGEALPIYSGGLGILAGDYLKTASDLGVPVEGVGILFQQGYFRQVIDSFGEQTEFYPYNDPSQLPIIPVLDKNGDWLRIKINFPGRSLWLRIWEAKVGRVKLYLMDSNDPLNSPSDRGITSELYGGGLELRLQQEIILGIGGWRLLQAMGIKPDVCHLNEGHAALVVLERARDFMMTSNQPFEVALAATSPGNIFTTHTPVEAGFDQFSPELIAHYLTTYVEEINIDIAGLLALGRINPANLREPLNMAYLAVRGSGYINAVSNLHQKVSRRIFQPLFPRWAPQEVPITYVTNGVHVPSWDSAIADTTWTNACGKERWLNTMDTIENDLKMLSDESIWNLRLVKSQQLINYVKVHLKQQLTTAGAPIEQIKRCIQLLDPGVFTIGFARRFTGYKRPNLLLNDPDRLARIINNPEQPIQLIIAGKAHPRDEEGKMLVREWWQYSLRPDVQGKVIFLSDYDMALAEQLVQGVDLWINTPRRPWEACGTSGMKVLVNGGLNLSELDGWWAEAYRANVGWALGDGLEHADDKNWDAQESRELYRLLEDEVLPCFYNSNNRGIPEDWVARMRESMAELTPRFSANRMLREYVDKLYVNAKRNYMRRTADAAQEAVLLLRWRELLRTHWPKLFFIKFDVQKEGSNYIFTVTIYLDKLDPKTVCIQLFADPRDREDPEIHPMDLANAPELAAGNYKYYVRIPASRPVEDYTPRIIPAFQGAQIPLEASFILWYER